MGSERRSTSPASWLVLDFLAAMNLRSCRANTLTLWINLSHSSAGYGFGDIYTYEA